MSEIKLPCEIGDSDEKVTFSRFEEIEEGVRKDMSDAEFSRIMENSGDTERIEKMFSVSKHNYRSPMLPVGLLLSHFEDPTWETVLWAQSFAMFDGKSDRDGIRRVVEAYEAEDFE